MKDMSENTMYINKKSIAERVSARLEEKGISKLEFSRLYGRASRPAVSSYLNGKEGSMKPEKQKEFEAFCEEWLAENGEAAGISGGTYTESQTGETDTGVILKRENFPSADFKGITGLCSLCQETQDLGIVVGRSGYGKTYALKNYAKLPKVIHIECNETMNCKDIIRRIEHAVGMPKGTGSIDERLGRISTFFTMNLGYLLIMDEADKLLSKYTIKKIELIRSIADSSSVGVVLAGEPALEASLKAWDERFANRMGLIYKLGGLTRREVEKYFEGYEIEEAALEELYHRACNRNTGCFRLLDRTLNNVIRILKTSDKSRITYDVLKEASGMMIL